MTMHFDTIKTRALSSTSGLLPPVQPPGGGGRRPMLKGGKAIGAYVFPGDPNGHRKIFHLVKTGRIPVFRMGSMIATYPETLDFWMKDDMERNAGRPVYLAAHNDNLPK